MNHIDEAQMIAYYYRELLDVVAFERHMEECAPCSQSFAELRAELALFKPAEAPSRGEDYSEKVWRSIRSSLPVYAKPSSKGIWRQWWQPLGWVAACALLVAVGFLAGRQWQRKQSPEVAVSLIPGARQRVVVVVLSDHLDRSERLLVALNHAGAHDAATLLQPGEAEELLASNRLIRQSARQAGDLRVEGSLDRLERLLVELANQQGGLTGAEITRLKEQMNTDGLLFDIRVLQARVQSRPSAAQDTATKGASI